MEKKHNIRLTSSEIGYLWANYQGDSLAKCVLTVFLHNVEDTETRPAIEYALSLAQNHLEKITEIFTGDHIPIPLGFTDEDINLNAPRLFSDSFYLNYLLDMAKGGLHRTPMLCRIRTDKMLGISQQRV
ncbi:hypothetical protein B1NLA3E_21130 [Bacillus sp. 1NLA3E]|nr:DUF3231 family protein [Bacillus sp. 1NLA3E]AGK55964.1 hypothetical protein B1NLA3E_21130 [Bacillus sp. 1NLA3E]